jgi:hypothetical protein
VWWSTRSNHASSQVHVVVGGYVVVCPKDHGNVVTLVRIVDPNAFVVLQRWLLVTEDMSSYAPGPSYCYVLKCLKMTKSNSVTRLRVLLLPRSTDFVKFPRLVHQCTKAVYDVWSLYSVQFHSALRGGWRDNAVLPPHQDLPVCKAKKFYK